MPEPSEAPATATVVRRGLLSAGLGLGVLLLVVVAFSRSEVGADAMADVWARARLGPLVVAIGAMSVAFTFMALRWRALMPPTGRPPPIGGLTAIICSGLLLNYAVPGPFGEVGAAWFAHRRYGVPFPASLASGVAARLVGLITASMLAVAVWLLADLPVPAAYQHLVAVAATLLAVGGVTLGTLAARPGWWKNLSSRLAAALADTGRIGRLAARADAAVAQLAVALAEVATRGARAYALAAFWALCGHLTVAVGIAIAASSFGATPNPAGLLFTYATTTAGAVALFALPGSQVGWDAMFFALLVATSGLSVADSLAIAVVVRVQQLIVLVLGAIALAWLLPGAQAPGSEQSS